MVEHIDPSTIEDESLRQAFVSLMNVVENLSTKVADLSAENQQLRDEINRLKGEQGKPKIKAGKPRADLSSQKDRRESSPHHKSIKQDQIKIDREMLLQVDRCQLPEDAVFKGYQEVVVQDITFHTDNVLFRKEKYYSPTPKRTNRAP